MKTKRRSFVVALLVLMLLLSNVPFALAAKPKASSVGIFGINSNQSDMVLYTAVCIEEEDGLFVYTGQHPIDQQIGVYMSLTDSLSANSGYSIEEDTTYNAISGVYRFALGDKVKSGSEPDINPKMASVKRNDIVYFTHLSLDGKESLAVEKSTVTSTKGGTITTKDRLEKDFENGDFSVIFNDDGDVVGFCKSGVATAVLPSKGGDLLLWGIIGGVVILALIGGGIVVSKKKKKDTSPVSVPPQGEPAPQWNDGETVLNDTPDDLFPPVANSTGRYALIGHGGHHDGRIYPVPQEGVTIGREPDNSIRFPAQTPGVSRHHVRIFWQDGQLRLVDLNSSNGTYLNRGGRIPPMQSVPLNSGDMIYLGERKNAFELTQR